MAASRFILSGLAEERDAGHYDRNVNKGLLIFGAGEIAEIAEFYFSTDADRKVKAFVVDGEYLKEPTLMGTPVIALEELEKNFSPADHELFIGLSYSKLNRDRAEKCAQAIEMGYSLTSFVHSRTSLDCQPVMGHNCFILEDVTIQPFVRIGNNVTIWSGTHVGHHAQIDDNSFVTSHVIISGGVKVGKNCFLGVNATLRDHISIGDYTVVGAGALLLESAEPEGVYPGKSTVRASFPSSKLRKL
jgi:sugar O-acyltransferase (sialic acid O-acetyltransferase NeuD family)